MAQIQVALRRAAGIGSQAVRDASTLTKEASGRRCVIDGSQRVGTGSDVRSLFRHCACLASLCLEARPSWRCAMAWFIGGHVVLGLLVGGVTGMSKSPLASTLLPLLFTFSGGSVVALSVIEGTTPQDLALLGQQPVAFGLGTIVGLACGIKIGRDHPLPIKQP